MHGAETLQTITTARPSTALSTLCKPVNQRGWRPTWVKPLPLPPPCTPPHFIASKFNKFKLNLQQTKHDLVTLLLQAPPAVCCCCCSCQNRRPSPFITVCLCALRKKKKPTKNKCLQTLGYQEEDVGTRRTKRHDKKWTSNEIKSKLLFVSLKTRNPSNISHKPNIDAAMWATFSYNYSFYPSFSSADTKYRFFILLSSH